MKYEIKSVPLSSLVLSPLPVVLLVLGIVGGIMAFVVVPNPMIEPMTTVGRLTAAGVFALIYMALILAVIVAGAFIYNVLCAGLGLRGIQFQLEEAEPLAEDETTA